MARIAWVDVYLRNWAMWKAREEGGGLGFASQSSFLRESVASGYRECIIPIDECDAAKTNQAVESLKPSRTHLYDCIYAIYVSDLTIRGAALQLGKAESTIKAQLDAADHALSIWFYDHSARRKDCAT